MTVLLQNAAQVMRLPAPGARYLRHDRASEISLEPGSVFVERDVIGEHDDGDAEMVIDCAGAAVVPGFVDCHTHLPFSGWRAEEYAQKVAGLAYEEIARSGGGIASSATTLGEASDEDVLRQAGTIRAEMLAHGTTAFEAKSGYGLSVATEERLVELAHRLEADAVTGLFAHAVPSGWKRDAWMNEVEKLVGNCPVDALDIYVESMTFDNEDLERMGAIAARGEVPLRAHVEQFNTNRSVPVAIAAGARSVDHLACLHPDDLGPLAGADCAAVLLPGAELLGEENVAPGRRLADAGAICAVATDCNPGTSPILSMPLILGLAVRRYRWSIREGLLACTLNAAWVLGLSALTGSIEPGKRADLLVLDGPVEHIAYRFGRNPVAVVLRGGEPVWVRPDQAWRVQR